MIRIKFFGKLFPPSLMNKFSISQLKVIVNNFT
nr:MAG TPA: hypothetical protein [Caudoviricetes sp.]